MLLPSSSPCACLAPWSTRRPRVHADFQAQRMMCAYMAPDVAHCSLGNRFFICLEWKWLAFLPTDRPQVFVTASTRVSVGALTFHRDVVRANMS